MMYRPTVRYDDIYREYVDSLFRVTTLDRNQIIRLALFTAAHSKEFKSIIGKYKKLDVPLPSSLWKPTDHRLWMEQCVNNKKGEKDVNERTESSGVKKIEIDTGINEHTNRTCESGEKESSGRIEQNQGRTRPILERTSSGGVKIKIG